MIYSRRAGAAGVSRLGHHYKTAPERAHPTQPGLPPPRSPPLPAASQRSPPPAANFFFGDAGLSGERGVLLSLLPVSAEARGNFMLPSPRRVPSASASRESARGQRGTPGDPVASRSRAKGTPAAAGSCPCPAPPEPPEPPAAPRRAAGGRGERTPRGEGARGLRAPIPRGGRGRAWSVLAAPTM